MKINPLQSFTTYLGDQLDLTADQREAALYGLKVLTVSPTTFLFICLVAWPLGCLWTTIVASFTAVALRHYSHGAHNNSPLTCTIKSMVVYPALGKIALIAAPYLTWPGLLLLFGLGFLLTLPVVWLCAPADSPAKPVTDPQDRRWLRLASIIAVCFLVAVQVLLTLWLQNGTLALAVGLGLWWQAFTLTGSGHRFVTLFDTFSMRKEVNQ